MTIDKTTALSLAALLICSMLTNFAHAGAADMTSADGSRIKFEYQGDKLRINTAEKGSYMIINEDGMFVVANTEGQVMVIDAGKAMGMFAGMAPTAPAVASSEVVSLKATGKKEKKAGIVGEVYKLRYVDKDSSKVQSTELLLSDDPRAVEMTQAISMMAAAMVKATGQDQQGSNELQGYMNNLNKGVLRYGKDMWVTAISTRAIANDRFVLPAPPQDLSAMADFADALRKSSTGNQASKAAPRSDTDTQNKGLVSGFLSVFGDKAGKQADRQQDRAEAKADEAMNEATDEAVDNALEKAFDKLFGN
mgnify:CR=1 FL=1